jgi:salicylate hydroxylase
MTQQLLIAGGGIGGLAAAIAARRAGWEVRLYEQSPTLTEAGAGIQLGPNATAILQEWGLLDGELAARPARPQRLRVHDAIGGAELASLRLGESFAGRYGAPYLTFHRADLHAALLRAATAAGTHVQAGQRIHAVQTSGDAVRVAAGSTLDVEGDALVGADGIWSDVRPRVVADGPPLATGHLAWRSLARQADLPERLRSQDVTAWLGPRMHLVTYPVRGGEWLNAVCVVEGGLEGDVQGWDHAGDAAVLEAALGRAGPQVRERLQAMTGWRLWVLHDRPPLRGPHEMAAGRIALLGDAAHPMRPYLAQGAGMALEDARELQRVLAVADGRTIDVPTALRRYALNRWQRCARVQRRARRNGLIFHATGPLRWGRDAAMRVLGEHLLDLPWLYRGPFS